MRSLAPARAWATQKALPLWADAGFDAARGLFHERLDFERRPIALPALRLMVQARQIATYARAGLAGWHNAGETALACLDRVTRLYHRADGHPGWVFAVAPDGRPANATRDLYAHAFILYALAWGFRVDGDPGKIRLADATLAEIDAVLAAPHGGYRDAAPAPDAIRRQNPHMHLLEALLALAEASGEERFFARAEALVGLARERFIDRASGALLEDFSEDWQPLHPHGENRVEPGHCFEWAWLLGEFERLGGTGVREERERLLAHGHAHGIDDTGLVRDAVTEDGRVLAATVRSWPHAEGVKALASAHRAGDPRAAATADALLDRLMTAFAPDRLEGGWIDRLGIDGAPLVDHMPASTLYHIMGAIFEADAVFGPSGRG